MSSQYVELQTHTMFSSVERYAFWTQGRLPETYSILEAPLIVAFDTWSKGEIKVREESSWKS